MGQDPYETQERIIENFQNPIAEDMDELAKVGAGTSYIQSQMQSDDDSAESIADSDLEDVELRKIKERRTGKPVRKFSVQKMLIRRILEDLFLKVIKITCSVMQDLNS